MLGFCWYYLLLHQFLVSAATYERSTILQVSLSCLLFLDFNSIWRDVISISHKLVRPQIHHRILNAGNHKFVYIAQKVRYPSEARIKLFLDARTVEAVQWSLMPKKNRNYQTNRPIPLTKSELNGNRPSNFLGYFYIRCEPLDLRLILINLIVG